MQTSILIARLIGPLLVMTGLIMLVTSQAVQDMAREFLASRALIFIAGVLALLGGLAIVNTHNVWTAGWPVIITIFGWLAVIGGIVRMGFYNSSPGVKRGFCDQCGTSLTWEGHIIPSRY